MGIIKWTTEDHDINLDGFNVYANSTLVEMTEVYNKFSKIDEYKYTDINNFTNMDDLNLKLEVIPVKNGIEINRCDVFVKELVKNYNIGSEWIHTSDVAANGAYFMDRPISKFWGGIDTNENEGLFHFITGKNNVFIDVYSPPLAEVNVVGWEGWYPEATPAGLSNMKIRFYGFNQQDRSDRHLIDTVDLDNITPDQIVGGDTLSGYNDQRWMRIDIHSNVHFKGYSLEFEAYTSHDGTFDILNIVRLKIV